MIENIIKILNKLSNIEKYKVYFFDISDTKKEVTYTYDECNINIIYDNGSLRYYNANHGTVLTIELDEINKCEVLKLFYIIQNNCKAYTLNQLELFANSTDDEEID